MQPFEQETCFFKSAFFAGGIYAHEHLSGRQDGGKTVHVETIMHCTHRKRDSGALEQKGRQ